MNAGKAGGGGSARTRLRLALGSVLCAVSLGWAGNADAQQPYARPSRLPAFGRSTVSDDDSTALVQNPANLAFMPASEFRWSSVYLSDEAVVPWQGHSLAFAFPLPIVPLSTGLRLDIIDPPSSALLPTPLPNLGIALGNYQWLTWGLALGSADTAAIGFSLQRMYSETAALHGLFTWSLGFTTRPFDQLGMAFTAQDINAPNIAFGARYDRSYDIALAIRPFTSRVVEVGLEAKYVGASDGVWVPRGTLGVDVGPLGRLRGEFSVSDPTEDSTRSWLASLSLAFYMNAPGGSSELAGGSLIGDGLGNEARYDAQDNIVTDVAFRGWREPVGIEAPRYALRVRIESMPDVREHVALLRRLWAIAEHEPKVLAVVFELRTSPAGSMAHVQELRDAIHYLRERGKRVLCHLEDADGSSLYMCAAANRILINPAGGLRFAGLRTRYFYYKGLLDKLGIRAEVVRIGAHKSAPEMFTEYGATPVSRADKTDLLQQHERQFVEGVAGGRRVTPDALRERIAKGPFIASEAKAAGLVDDYAFDDQLEEQAGKLLGRRIPLLDDKRAPRAPSEFGSVPGVAIVYVDGDMVDGRSETIPLLGNRLVGSYTIAETLKKVREDPRIGAVVLRVETGGGSAMAADVIWREVQLTVKQKPVIVSMGAFAASGGYYIAAPATRLFANPLTITGSIGIFYGKADVAELLRKIGVNVEVYKTAPRADAESIFRPYTEDERRELQRKVGQFYGVFLSRVALGRGMTTAQVDKVGQGRVWTGEQAQARRLVDELGGLRQALRYARQQAGLPEHAPIVELPPPDISLLGRLLGIEGLKADAAGTRVPVPPQLRELIVALAPFVVHPPDRPLAKLELVPVQP